MNRIALAHLYLSKIIWIYSLDCPSEYSGEIYEIGFSKYIDLSGYPVDFGAGRRWVDMVNSALCIANIERKLETIAECGCISSLEVAEVNPILDTRSLNAEITAELVASSIGLRIL